MNKQTTINFLESLVNDRFESVERIEQELYSLFEVPIKLEHVYYEESFDHNLIGTIETNDIFVDIDIYFLNDKQDNFYITEVGYEFQ